MIIIVPSGETKVCVLSRGQDLSKVTLRMALI